MQDWNPIQRGDGFEIGPDGRIRKLTPEKIAAAKARIDAGETYRAVAPDFGVSFHALWKAINGQTHKPRQLKPGRFTL